MNTIWKSLSVLALAGGLICATACEEKKPESATTTPEATTEAPTEAPAEVVEKEDGDKIAVSAEGAKIDPPVAKAKIPAGAYYCDMGTVHYARMDKGDGKCPECGMMLTQMPAEGAANVPAGAVAEKSACGCATGEKCEACQKAGDACKCGSGEACEHCESCEGAKVAGAHACNHAPGETCDCAHAKKGHDHAGHGGHGDHAH